MAVPESLADEAWIVDPRAVVALLWSWKLGFTMNDVDADGATDDAWHALLATAIDMLLTPG